MGTMVRMGTLQIHMFKPTPPHTHTPEVIVLGGGAFGKWLDHKGRALMNEISRLIRGSRELSIPCEEGTSLRLGKKCSPKYANMPILDF